MNKGAVWPVTGCGVVIDRTREPRPGLVRPTQATWQRAFPGEDSQLSLMRRWLRSILPECPALEDVLTVADEFAANAVCHTRTGRGGWFSVEITWAPELVRVAVADLGGMSVPALRDDPEGVHGRGLVLARALSTRTGVLGGHNGRKVWAEIAWDGPEPRQSEPRDLSSREGDQLMTTLGVAEAIADALTGSGFDVRSPAWENAVNLKVTNVRSALCELTISSEGRFTWDYSTFDGGRTRAEHIISIVLDLLSPGWDDTIAVRLPSLPDLTLKGLVGRALVERGLDVSLSLPERDEQFFEAYAEISIGNPAEPDRGTVRVADHGAISWACQVREAAGCSGGLGTNDIATTIARALSRTQPASCPA
jgi:serine/threonine-protein kinase RsbW